MSLARRTGYLERTVDPRLGEDLSRKADIISVWEVEHILDLPTAASYDDCVDIGLDSRLLTLAVHQQVQVRLSHHSGDLGVESSRHRWRPAFLGSIAIALPALLAILDGSWAPAFRVAVCKTPTVRALFLSTRSMVADGVAVDDLGKVLPAEWVAAAIAGGSVSPPSAPSAEVLTVH